MATQITATLPTLNFPKEVDYPTQEDWAAFSADAELNFGILGGGWSTQMQLWKNEANAMSTELNTNATIAQGLADYQGDWISQGYTLNQTVSVSGIYYICKLTHATGQNPTAGGSLYWNLALGNWNLKVDTNMSGYTSKTTPVDTDLIPLSDSASTFGIKKLSWANLKGNVTNIAYKSTPVTITSWSYIGTTITLNVASHTFVAGDYIKTKGLTSTTYPANGVYLVTNVTPKTIVFTHFTTPTGTAGVSTATVKGFTTVNGVALGNENVTKVQSNNDYSYLPDGRILQWGEIAGNGTGNVTGTLPIIFPNSWIGVTGLSFSHGATATIVLQLSGLTNSTIHVESRNSSSGALQNVSHIRYGIIGY